MLFEGTSFIFCMETLPYMTPSSLTEGLNIPQSQKNSFTVSKNFLTDENLNFSLKNNVSGPIFTRTFLNGKGGYPPPTPNGIFL